MNFNFTSQICTTKEQSERLLAFGIKAETADCILVENAFKKDSYLMFPIVDIDETFVNEMCDEPIPAWSLHRLIVIIPITIPDKSGITHHFTIEGTSDISYYYFGEESWEIWKSWNKKGLYDNIIDCIEWLIKEGYFNKEYLKE